MVPSSAAARVPTLAEQGAAIAASMQEYLAAQPPLRYIASSTLFSEAVALSTHIGTMDWYAPCYAVAPNVSAWLDFQCDRLATFATEHPTKTMDAGWVRHPAGRWNPDLPTSGWLLSSDVQLVYQTAQQRGYAVTLQMSVNELRDWPDASAALSAIARIATAGQQ